MLFHDILIEILCSFGIAFLTGYDRISCDLYPADDKIQIGMINAFATLVFILLCYPQTRCHFSPTLTVSDIIYKKLSFENGMMIIISQFVGGLIASSLIILTLNNKDIQTLGEKSIIGFSVLNKNFLTMSGFLISLFLNSFFVYVNLIYSNTGKNDRGDIMHYALVRASTIFLISLAGESICGIDSNPFSVITGALLTKNFKTYQWIYILSSIIGAFLGGCLYQPDTLKQLFWDDKHKEKEKSKLE